MASRTSCSAASAVSIFRPEKARTAAMVSKSSGSAMASVSVESWIASGKKRHCRMKRAESPSSSGGAGGGESSVTSGRASCSESAASTSRSAMKPLFRFFLPSLSPRSFCNSRARSRSSGWIRRRAMSISPRRSARGLDPQAGTPGGWGLGSCIVANLELHRADGGFARGVRQQLLALGLHHDLGGKATVVFPGVVEQRNRQHHLFAGRQVLQRHGGGHQHFAHLLLQQRQALDFAVMNAGDFDLGERLTKRGDVGADNQVQLGAEDHTVALQIDPARGAEKVEGVRRVGPGEAAVETLLHAGESGARDARMRGRRSLLRGEEERQQDRECVHRTSPLVSAASLLARIWVFRRLFSTSMYWSKRSFISWVSIAWRVSEAANNSRVWRAWRASL